MPLKLVVATGNSGKLREIKDILKGDPIEVLSLKDFPGCPESEEPFQTYLENARDKARLVAEHCGTWALADDSGLEVEALGGRPGVLSARYAGEGVSYEDNYRKVLTEMEDIEEGRRGAVFYCCMVLRHPDGREFVTEGRLKGRITPAPRGDQGFGYDPIFYSEELHQTLAEIPLARKNQISHRHRALLQMAPILHRLSVP